MSYDIHLEIDTGGPEPAVVGRDFNMTSNVGPMWRKAGADLADFEGKKAGTVVSVLDAAVAQMKAQPDEYRALNPSNGWGTYEGCLEFLEELRDTCAANPNATVRVCR